jgi:hypothetical protein
MCLWRRCKSRSTFSQKFLRSHKSKAHLGKELGIMYLTITKDSIDLPPGGEVVLRHQTWADYEELLANRQDNAAIKIYFDGRTQEIQLI